MPREPRALRTECLQCKRSTALACSAGVVHAAESTREALTRAGTEVVLQSIKTVASTPRLSSAAASVALASVHAQGTRKRAHYSASPQCQQVHTLCALVWHTLVWHTLGSRWQVPLAPLEVASTCTTASNPYKCPSSGRFSGRKWALQCPRGYTGRRPAAGHLMTSLLRGRLAAPPSVFGPLPPSVSSRRDACGESLEVEEAGGPRRCRYSAAHFLPLQTRCSARRGATERCEAAWPLPRDSG